MDTIAAVSLCCGVLIGALSSIAGMMVGATLTWRCMGREGRPFMVNAPVGEQRMQPAAGEDFEDESED